MAATYDAVRTALAPRFEGPGLSKYVGDFLSHKAAGQTNKDKSRRECRVERLAAAAGDGLDRFLDAVTSNNVDAKQAAVDRALALVGLSVDDNFVRAAVPALRKLVSMLKQKKYGSVAGSVTSDSEDEEDHDNGSHVVLRTRSRRVPTIKQSSNQVSFGPGYVQICARATLNI